MPFQGSGGKRSRAVSHPCPSAARGDTFEEAEEDQSTLETPVDALAPSAAPFSSSAAPFTSSAAPLTSERPGPPPAAPPADRDAAACSARPFDAFLQLKNGSVYAFRGASPPPPERRYAGSFPAAPSPRRALTVHQNVKWRGEWREFANAALPPSSSLRLSRFGQTESCHKKLSSTKMAATK